MSLLFSRPLSVLLRRCSQPLELDFEQGFHNLRLLWKEIFRTCYIERLPNDVLVDQIFGYLDVVDILRLRQLNKFFYQLSHHIVLWKRLLRRVNVPLPPLPPTARHSLPYLSGLEAERLLRRAISLERCWNSERPRYLQHWSFNSHHHIHGMVLLPGGQYLIASVADKARNNHAIVIFVMDHQAGAIALAKTPTQTKAYHLQARYMTVLENRSIVISYVHRTYSRSRDRNARAAPNRIDISEYSPDHEIDPQVPIKYECVTLEAPLEQLEILADPRIPPGSDEFLEYARSLPSPFRLLTVIRTRRQLIRPALDEMFGAPYLAVVRLPNSIMFKNLNAGPVSTLNCANTSTFPIFAHKIMAIRLIPVQDTVLVMRKIELPRTQFTHDITTIEYFRALPSAFTAQEVSHSPDEWITLGLEGVVDIQISDHGIPTREDDSIMPVLYSAADAMAPRPISIFLRTVNPDAFARYTIHPKRVEYSLPPTPSSSSSPSAAAFTKSYATYTYPLHIPTYYQMRNGESDSTYRILAGSLRSIVYTVPKDDRTATPPILRLSSYRSLKSPEDDNEISLRRIAAPPNLPLESITSLAWDETIGRLCLAGNGSEIAVLEFSSAPRRNRAGNRDPLPLVLEPNPDETNMPIDLMW